MTVAADRALVVAYYECFERRNCGWAIEVFGKAVASLVPDARRGREYERFISVRLRVGNRHETIGKLIGSMPTETVSRGHGPCASLLLVRCGRRSRSKRSSSKNSRGRKPCAFDRSVRVRRRLRADAGSATRRS